MIRAEIECEHVEVNHFDMAKAGWLFRAGEVKV